MRRRLAATLVLLLLIAGCSTDKPTARATPSATPTPTPTPVKPSPPPRPPGVSAEVACGGTAHNLKAYDPGAAAYAGNRLHKATIERMSSNGSATITTDLPKAWDASLNFLDHIAELLVCEQRDASYHSHTVNTCRYTGDDGTKSTAKVLSARYRYRVFEARTGRPVVTFTLPATVDSCPGIVQGSADDTYYQVVNDSQLAAKLKPYVVGPARH
jgi:hypothetical protein